MTYKTVNRGWLRKQIEAGNVEAKCTISLTDDYAFDAAINFGKMEKFIPCEMRAENGPNWKEGVIVFGDWELRGKGGGAYTNSKEPGIIHLRVHSNLHYDLRIKEQPKTAVQPKAAPSSDGSQPTITHQGTWTWIKFDNKPGSDVLDAVRELGGKFSGKRVAWYIREVVDEATIMAAIG